MKHFDVIVLGLGGMGASAAYHLARRGLKTLGLEQYSLGHDKGSSHGDVRLIRKAYFEESRYVPLLHQSYDLWRDLEEETDRLLLHQVGLLIFSRPNDSMAYTGLTQAAEKYSIPIETLDAAQCRENYPWFSAPSDYVGLLEPGAGYLEVEKCVLTYLERAKRLGATLLQDEPVQEWKSEPGFVQVLTKSGWVSAARLVITAGPWAGQMLKELNLPLTVQRVPQFWFQAPNHFSKIPCFAFDKPEGFFYGFPNRPGLGLKMADYKPTPVEVKNPAAVDRNVTEQDYAKLSAIVSQHLPGVEMIPKKSSVCMYTMTPDENFIVDKHPKHQNVVLACGFSGHGFKFASVIGKALADLAVEGSTPLPIDFLRLNRFKS